MNNINIIELEKAVDRITDWGNYRHADYVDLEIAIDTIPKLLQEIERLKKDAARWQYTMSHQAERIQPGPMTQMWRNVINDGRLAPTREEYEYATDKCIEEEQHG